MNSIFRTVIFAMCMGSAVVSFAAKEHKKTLNESFDISNGATVELINKYGNMDIRTISANEVNIRVEILVDASSESKAEKVFERINVSFTGGGRAVKAETKIESVNSSFWKSIGSWNNNNKFEIHYYVEVPSHVYLQLTNKYGNIYADDMDNEMDITLKYGNFDIGNAHDLDLDLGYGNGNMDDVHELEADIKYSEITAKSAHDVDITSKYSKVRIDEAREMDVDSKYDKYRVKKADSFENEGKYDNLDLGEVDVVDIDSKHTDIEIDLLHKSAIIRTGYGGITINEITRDLEEIDIVSSYAGVEIGNPEDVGFRFNIHTKHGSIKIDEGNGEFGEDGNEEWANGKRPGKGSGNVKIESKYGSVKIR